MPKRIISKESVTNQEKLRDLLAYTDDVNDCYVWKGAVNSDGYAHMLGNVKVHRLVMELKYGKDITGKVVRHSCDNPLCINPDHLSLGTVLDNIQDMIKRDRHFRRVTTDKIKRVKELLQTGLLKHIEIAKIVQLDQRRISDISRGKYLDNGRFLKN